MRKAILIKVKSYNAMLRVLLVCIIPI